MHKKPIKILAVSGSLRGSSSNSIIIKAIGKMMPGHVNYVVYNGLGTIPHFNDTDEPSESLSNWKEQVSSADGILISIPEYAFGVPGTFKNALDWTVSSGEFYRKNVAVITASTSGEKAHEALLNILTALNSNVLEGGTLLIKFVRSKLNDKGEISDAATLQAVQSVISALLTSIEHSAGVD